MANYNKKGKPSSNRSKTKRNYGSKKKMEPGNSQDDAMVKEYNKGRASVPIETGSYNNDPQWYVPNGQLARDVASFPSGIPNGRPLTKESRIVTNTTGINPPRSTAIINESNPCPGIMVFNIVPTFGSSYDVLSPISIANNALFTAVRKATSGTSYYEQPDMMMGVAALAQCFSFYVWMTRAYGIMQKFSLEDWYLPRALFSAMNLDYDDFLANIADFRAFINTFAYQLSAFAVPKNVNYITRQIFMYESVYTDSNGRKPQYYMYNPRGFYVLKTFESPWVLEYTPLNEVSSESPQGPNLTFSDLKTYAEQLIRPIVQSEDYRYIQADFLKAFGVDNMYKVTPIAETYTVTPTYSQEVLMQMENAFIYPTPDEIDFSLTQGAAVDGYFKTNYNMNFSNDSGSSFWYNIASTSTKADPAQAMMPDDIILNFHKDEVTPEDILVATRLASKGMQGLTSRDNPTSQSGGKIFTWSPTDPATEIVVGAAIFNYDYTAGNTDVVNLTYTPIESINTNGIETGFNTSTAWIAPSAAIHRIALLSTFDWHPKVKFTVGYFSASTTTADQNIHVTPWIYDLDVFVRISQLELNHINEVALMGLFSAGKSSDGPGFN